MIVHDRVAKDWAAWKPYQIKSWRKRFRERADALKDVNPIDNVVSFTDRMTLKLGGKTIELIYVDDPYNPGDIAVWLPQSGVMHAGFVGYIDRHPDIRPDYSHGTTWGMLQAARGAQRAQAEGDDPRARPARRRQGPARAHRLSAAGAAEGPAP